MLHYIIMCESLFPAAGGVAMHLKAVHRSQRRTSCGARLLPPAVPKCPLKRRAPPPRRVAHYLETWPVTSQQHTCLFSCHTYDLS